MKRFKAKLSLIILMLSPVISYAWSAVGHVLVAQIAYDQLSLAKQKQTDELASSIYNSLPDKQRQRLNAQFPNASLFAKVASLPDTWHNSQLTSIFKTFKAELPADFTPYSKELTGSWHYIDTPYPNTRSCNMDSSKNVVWAINTLESHLANKNTTDFNAKALQMVMLEHFIGDIHQPLHIETNVSASCDGDRGGNSFCLKRNTKGKCKINLHSYWDGGLGYLRTHEDVVNLAYEIEKAHPISEFTKQLQEKNPSVWAKIDTAQMFFVYDTPQFSMPSSQYNETGQAFVKTQLALAGYRIAEAMDQFLTNNA